MENMPKQQTMYFNPETGKISPVKADKTVALAMAADGFFAVTEGAAAVVAVCEYAIAEHNKQTTDRRYNRAL